MGVGVLEAGLREVESEDEVLGERGGEEVERGVPVGVLEVGLRAVEVEEEALSERGGGEGAVQRVGRFVFFWWKSSGS